ncbi:MAG TPA: SH3 domain-containing protein [Candidatus Limnocylindria bacterium]
MKPIRPAAGPLLTLLILSACLVDIQPASRTPRPTISLSPTPSPSATPSPRPSPTPGLRAVPIFAAGDRVAVSAPGLRVRARPGVEQRVITSLGPGAELLIALGPVWVDDTGWYLVRDANRADLGFTTGWLAAGTTDDPFLTAATFDVRANPYLAGFAGEGDGNAGPVMLANSNVSIIWLAAPPTSGGCSFSVALARPTGDSVQAIRATIGGVPAPGEQFPSFFDAHDELIGRELSVSVTSDCSWALTFVRQRPEPQPSP